MEGTRPRARRRAGALIPADVRLGTWLDAVRHALSANAQHGERREAGDYVKGYAIAVRCGLCQAHDVDAVRALLACSERWARELTHTAREAVARERNARIADARQAGETVRRIAAREGIGVATVLRVPLRQPAESEHAPAQPPPPPIRPAARNRPVPSAVAALDRPSLAAWSDAIYALEKLIEAMRAAQGHRVPPKAMPRIRALIARTGELLSTTNLEAEDDAA